MTNVRLSRKAQEMADGLADKFGLALRRVASAYAEKAGKEFADCDDVAVAYGAMLDEISKEVKAIDESQEGKVAE